MLPQRFRVYFPGFQDFGKTHFAHFDISGISNLMQKVYVFYILYN
jgi:hypothetical protein